MCAGVVCWKVDHGGDDGHAVLTGRAGKNCCLNLDLPLVCCNSCIVRSHLERVRFWLAILACRFRMMADADAPEPPDCPVVRCWKGMDWLVKRAAEGKICTIISSVGITRQAVADNSEILLPVLLEYGYLALTTFNMTCISDTFIPCATSPRYARQPPHAGGRGWTLPVFCSASG